MPNIVRVLGYQSVVTDIAVRLGVPSARAAFEHLSPFTVTDGLSALAPPLRNVVKIRKFAVLQGRGFAVFLAAGLRNRISRGIGVHIGFGFSVTAFVQMDNVSGDAGKLAVFKSGLTARDRLHRLRHCDPGCQPVGVGMVRRMDIEREGKRGNSEENGSEDAFEQ